MTAWEGQAARQTEAERLHEQLVDQVAALVHSDRWRRFLDFAASFHTYSLTNVLLILGQYPTASMVAGYRQWQARGPRVRKGEKAIRTPWVLHQEDHHRGPGYG
jgi:N-terminal domain of anti-restriction factor ArdC